MELDHPGNDHSSPCNRWSHQNLRGNRGRSRLRCLGNDMLVNALRSHMCYSLLPRSRRSMSSSASTRPMYSTAGHKTRSRAKVSPPHSPTHRPPAAQPSSTRCWACERCIIPLVEAPAVAIGPFLEDPVFADAHQPAHWPQCHVEQSAPTRRVTPRPSAIRRIAGVSCFGALEPFGGPIEIA